MITEHINNTAAERQKRQKAIEAELKNTCQIGTIEAELKNGVLILRNDIPFDTEIFAIHTNSETAAELVYFLEHVLKHQK